MPRRIIPLPRFPVAKAAHRGSYRARSAWPEYSSELESRALFDGIIQAAGGANHRNGAVPQAIDLVQPAGFVAAGHQEDVRPGLDAVRQTVVETDP